MVENHPLSSTTSSGRKTRVVKKSLTTSSNSILASREKRCQRSILRYIMGRDYPRQPIHRIISTGIKSPDYLNDRKVTRPTNYLDGARWLPRIILTSGDEYSGVNVGWACGWRNTLIVGVRARERQDPSEPPWLRRRDTGGYGSGRSTRKARTRLTGDHTAAREPLAENSTNRTHGPAPRRVPIYGGAATLPHRRPHRTLPGHTTTTGLGGGTGSSPGSPVGDTRGQVRVPP